MVNKGIYWYALKKVRKLKLPIFSFNIKNNPTAVKRMKPSSGAKFMDSVNGLNY